MNTEAHQEYSRREFHVEFFDESAESFVEVIENLYSEGFSTAKRNENLKRIAADDWDVIASQKILPRFFDLVAEEFRAKPRYASNIFDRICSWDLPVEDTRPEPGSPSRIRIAAVVGERLYRGLNLECELLLLTPENWRSSLSYARPDRSAARHGRHGLSSADSAPHHFCSTGPASP